MHTVTFKTKAHSSSEKFTMSLSPTSITNRSSFASLFAFTLGKSDGNEWDQKLVDASTRGDFQATKECLKKKANINYRNRGGDTALLCAVENNHTLIAKLLLASGANVDIQNLYGQTALILAVDKDNEELVNELLIHGACVNSQDKFGQTPLICASGEGKYSIVRSILHSAAMLCDVNIRDAHGQTALVAASRAGYIDIVIELIRAGSNVTAKNKGGHTALQAAAREGYVEIVAWLRCAQNWHFRKGLLVFSSELRAAVCKQRQSRLTSSPGSGSGTVSRPSSTSSSSLSSSLSSASASINMIEEGGSVYAPALPARVMLLATAVSSLRCTRLIASYL